VPNCESQAITTAVVDGGFSEVDMVGAYVHAPGPMKPMKEDGVPSPDSKPPVYPPLAIFVMQCSVFKNPKGNSY